MRLTFCCEVCLLRDGCSRASKEDKLEAGGAAGIESSDIGPQT